jgi:hypothetical protein
LVSVQRSRNLRVSRVTVGAKSCVAGWCLHGLPGLPSMAQGLRIPQDEIAAAIQSFRAS